MPVCSVSTDPTTTERVLDFPQSRNPEHQRPARRQVFHRLPDALVALVERYGERFAMRFSNAPFPFPYPAQRNTHVVLDQGARNTPSEKRTTTAEKISSRSRRSTSPQSTSCRSRSGFISCGALIPHHVFRSEVGAIVFGEACRPGCEWIVSKRIGSIYLYRRGRSPTKIRMRVVKREVEEDWGPLKCDAACE